MKDKKTVAISIGDLNGIGLEIALKGHTYISKIVNPIYCINKQLLSDGAKLLDMKIPKDFKLFQTKGYFKITPSKISSKSGLYSYNSFIDGINLIKHKKADAILTLPIHKKAWEKAGISYHGHTEVLRDIFAKDAIMMLGCDEMFVALFTEHIALKDVAKYIKKDKLVQFLLDLYSNVKTDKIAVLALNPHAGDNGVMGDEEKIIQKAISKANKKLKKRVFYGAMVPDVAFTKPMREEFKYYVALYHDQGLIPLKTLYFEQSINVSLNLPIMRVSVDHGTAFDIAYQGKNVNLDSYINAVKYSKNYPN